MDWIIEYAAAFWKLFNEMAFYLLIGFLFAGILSVYIRKERIAKFMGKRRAKSVLNASLLGIPMPLCSCGVIPTALSFHKNGASKGATTAFLISTPQTGVDSILASYSLLGLPMAIIRALVAFITGVVGGLFVNASETASQESTPNPAPEMSIQGSKWKTALRYGFVDFMEDIGKWLLIGIAIAALFAVVIPDNFFMNHLSNPIINMLLVLVASIPLYVCATGSVPIAAVLMMKGLSPGAALVFLMAGPATNAATFTVLVNQLGKKTTAIYLATIVLGSLLFGTVLDLFLPANWFILATQPEESISFHFIPKEVMFISSLILIVLLLNSFRRKVMRSLRETETGSHLETEQAYFTVGGMTCKNCKAHVEEAAMRVKGVKEVNADLKTGKIYISENRANIKEIMQSIEEAGYSCKAEENLLNRN